MQENILNYDLCLVRDVTSVQSVGTLSSPLVYYMTYACVIVLSYFHLFFYMLTLIAGCYILCHVDTMKLLHDCVLVWFG